MKRALPVKEFLDKELEVMDFDGNWFGAFDKPERIGVFFIWGNSSNGKSSFALMLAKYLTRFGTVGYNSLEEGKSLTMQRALKRCKMDEVAGKFVLLQESIEELSIRLSSRRSPDIVFIDSFQYSQMNYKKYIQFKEKHSNRLLVFVSQATGKQPSGRAAVSVMYDASLKIWVEGFRAMSKGRYIGTEPYFTIWHEGAERYWD